VTLASLVWRSRTRRLRKLAPEPEKQVWPTGLSQDSLSPFDRVADFLTDLVWGPLPGTAAELEEVEPETKEPSVRVKPAVAEMSPKKGSSPQREKGSRIAQTPEPTVASPPSSLSNSLNSDGGQAVAEAAAQVSAQLEALGTDSGGSTRPPSGSSGESPPAPLLADEQLREAAVAAPGLLQGSLPPGVPAPPSVAAVGGSPMAMQRSTLMPGAPPIPKVQPVVGAARRAHGEAGVTLEDGPLAPPAPPPVTLQHVSPPPLRPPPKHSGQKAAVRVLSRPRPKASCEATEVPATGNAAASGQQRADSKGSWTGSRTPIGGRTPIDGPTPRDDAAVPEESADGRPGPAAAPKATPRPAGAGQGNRAVAAQRPTVVVRPRRAHDAAQGRPPRPS